MSGICIVSVIFGLVGLVFLVLAFRAHRHQGCGELVTGFCIVAVLLLIVSGGLFATGVIAEKLENYQFQPVSKTQPGDK
jgi:hypothetical protein